MLKTYSVSANKYVNLSIEEIIARLERCKSLVTNEWMTDEVNQSLLCAMVIVGCHNYEIISTMEKLIYFNNTLESQPSFANATRKHIYDYEVLIDCAAKDFDSSLYLLNLTLAHYKYKIGIVG
jgi:hypothetical protein